MAITWYSLIKGENIVHFVLNTWLHTCTCCSYLVCVMTFTHVVCCKQPMWDEPQILIPLSQTLLPPFFLSFYLFFDLELICLCVYRKWILKLNTRCWIIIIEYLVMDKSISTKKNIFHFVRNMLQISIFNNNKKESEPSTF